MTHPLEQAAYRMIEDEDAAVTVDWVVLSAAVTAIALVALWPIFLGEGNILNVAVDRIVWATGFDWKTALE